MKRQKTPIKNKLLVRLALAGAIAIAPTAACGDAGVDEAAEDATAKSFYKCVLDGDQPIIDLQGKWGEIGEWCDPAALGEFQADVEKLVKERYPGLIIPSRQASWAARKPVIAKLVKLTVVSIHIALEKRGLREAWSAEEIDAFTLAALSQIFQDSYFGQYKLVDGKLKLMRGNMGRAHGATQIGEALHFDPVYKESAGWDLLHNLSYGMGLLLDQWESIKKAHAAGQAPCVDGDGAVDYDALARSAYSALKAGSTAKACRWAGADKRDGDVYFDKRLVQLEKEDLALKYGWVVSYPAALAGLEDIDILGILGIESLPGQPKQPNRPACNEEDIEGNDVEAQAQRLQSTDDCDSSASSGKGSLAGSADVDWFYFEAFDNSVCTVDASVTIKAAHTDVKLCTFFECVDGTLAAPSCPTGTTAADSPVGRKGCCGAGTITVKGLNCVGTTAEDIDVYIRVERPGGDPNECSPYSFTYHY